ncbi:hypothetical protein HPB50_027774 [Hyalomma asiaticum]|nr:hypothetical protein HPB50_027774 [Hyalomma asiaticum]
MFLKHLHGIRLWHRSRLTAFLILFPPARLCSACGLVPLVTGTLPCRHQICQPCFDRVDSSGRKSCPLDNESFRNEDVVGSAYKKDSALKRQMRCWNAANGYDAEDTACAMLDHFTSGCRFHTRKFPTCGESALHRCFLDHLGSGCLRQSGSGDRSLSENSANAFTEVKDALWKLSKKMPRYRPDWTRSKSTRR